MNWLCRLLCRLGLSRLGVHNPTPLRLLRGSAMTTEYSDSAVIVVARKARKQYRCPSEWAHDPTIRPGDVYARVKLTPGYGYSGWREFTYHTECAEDQVR